MIQNDPQMVGEGAGLLLGLPHYKICHAYRKSCFRYGVLPAKATHQHHKMTAFASHHGLLI